MSPKTLRWLLLSFIFLIFVSGCDCDSAEISAFVVTSDTPAGGVVVSSNPTLTWSESESCTPDRYKIWIDNHFFGGSSGHTEFADGSDTSYTLSSALDAGKKYTWWLYAVAEDQSINGVPSEGKDFYVGPMCSGQPLLPPILLNPGNNQLLNTIPPLTFYWEYDGGCLPSSYMYQFATDIGFTDIVDTGVVTDHQMEVTKSFPDCSTLWWRVAASDGTSSGPWSSPRAFHLANSSSCSQIADESINTAWIYMHLYADDCPSTGFAPTPGDPLNPGCVISDSGLILHGDGESWGESSLHDYVAQLGAGACPSTGLDEGTNRFLIQTPGVYCVSISKAQTVMNLDTSLSVNLQHGIWTEPFSYHTVAEQTVEFGPGSHNASVSFGWDQLDGLFVMPTLMEAKNCRIGPYPDCPIYDIPLMGAEVPLFARSADSEYKLSERNDMPCYIYLPDAEINEGLENTGFDWRAEDLPFFRDPGPCPKPETKPDPDPETQPKTCSDYATREECSAHSTDGCKWNINSLSCDGP